MRVLVISPYCVVKPSITDAAKAIISAKTIKNTGFFAFFTFKPPKSYYSLRHNILFMPTINIIILSFNSNVKGIYSFSPFFTSFLEKLC